MILRASTLFRRASALGLAACALASVLVLPATARAQTVEPPAREISEKVSGELGKLRTLIDAKNYSEALRLIDTLIAAAADPSYDLAILTQIKAQVLLFTSQYTAAVAPLETTLQLGERYAFFDQRTRLDLLYTLSQLYYQLATESKKPAEQNLYFDKAYEAISRWLAQVPVPTSDAQLYAASILYGQATVDSAHPDLDKIRQAQQAAEKSLYLDVRPKDQAYVLMLAALQQLGDLPQVADLLELMVQRQPASVNYWQQLAATYYALAADTRNDAEIERYNLRALLTLERAQARGFLNSPKENYAVIALYFNLHQFDRAIALLEAGLKTGAIENTRRNWELLSSAYQQTHDMPKALATLQQAVERFPREAGIEYSLGQLYYSLNQPAPAYDYLVKAVGKEHLERPGQTHLFLAYVAFELQRYDAAARWIEAGAAFPDVRQDDVNRLRRAVADKLRERPATTDNHR